MIDLPALYDFAAQHSVGVYWFSLDATESLSYMDADGTCYIAMDPWWLRTLAEEKTKLAHELGHCETGSFYNRYAKLDLRQKHENRADKWAIQHLIPVEELDERSVSWCRKTLWIKPWPTDIQISRLWRSISV